MHIARVSPKGCVSEPMRFFTSWNRAASRFGFAVHRIKWCLSSSQVLQHGQSFKVGSATAEHLCLCMPNGSRS